MKKIVAINASPRIGWNTWSMVSKAAEGAKSEGAEIISFDLYRLEKHGGCMSCFACKRKPNEGKCVFPDGLQPVLEAIRKADGLIIGSPNYIGDISSEFKAIYERLIFQSLTYQTEHRHYDFRRIPVLFIMTSNASEEFYNTLGYEEMMERYRKGLDASVGNTRLMISGNTLQVKDYSRYNWTMFNPEEKKERHDSTFPEEMKSAYRLGAEMVRKAW